MFSYCKRTSDSSRFEHIPYKYRVNALETPDGFSKNPVMCQSLNVPYVSNRGVPLELLDKELELKGQGRAFQPFCANPHENNQLEVNQFEWMKDAPVAKIGQPIPCAPTPVIEFKQFGGVPCDPRMDWCKDTPCGCKEHPFGMRYPTKPHAGVLPLHVTPGCRF